MYREFDERSGRKNSCRKCEKIERPKKTGKEAVKDGMKKRNLQLEDAYNRDK